ncbi:EAL domain-containing protein [Shigella flexneri]
MAQPIFWRTRRRHHEILVRLREMMNPSPLRSCRSRMSLACHLHRYVGDRTDVEISWHRIGKNARPAVCHLVYPRRYVAPHFPRHQPATVKYKVEAWQLIFEVTESNALTNAERHKQPAAAQSLGCQIAIDDFGTGYASYARRKNVSADTQSMAALFAVSFRIASTTKSWPPFAIWLG